MQNPNPRFSVAALLVILLVIFGGLYLSFKPTDKTLAPLGGVNTLTGPAEIYPNLTLTPGATNSTITQVTISQTICNPTWSTKTIRPSVSYTNTLKAKQIIQYGYTDTKPTNYEEDHLISLELGGNPSDPKNLWPEHYTASIPTGGAKIKDSVENYLHKQICAGSITLAEAQHEIVTDWYAVYLKMNPSGNLGAVLDQTTVDPDDN